MSQNYVIFIALDVLTTRVYYENCYSVNKKERFATEMKGSMLSENFFRNDEDGF